MKARIRTDLIKENLAVPTSKGYLLYEKLTNGIRYIGEYTVIKCDDDGTLHLKKDNGGIFTARSIDFEFTNALGYFPE